MSVSDLHTHTPHPVLPHIYKHVHMCRKEQRKNIPPLSFNLRASLGKSSMAGRHWFYLVFFHAPFLLPLTSTPKPLGSVSLREWSAHRDTWTREMGLSPVHSAGYGLSADIAQTFSGFAF